MNAVEQPLYAVTVTAAARVSTPVLLMLYWHGFRLATPLRILSVEIPAHAVPGDGNPEQRAASKPSIRRCSMSPDPVHAWKV